MSAMDENDRPDRRTDAASHGRTVDTTHPDDVPRQDATAAKGDGTSDGLKEQIMEALRQVDDPELGINIVDLGLVYGVELTGDTVHIEYTLTTMGCPIGPLIEGQIKQLIEPIEGVENVDAEMVLNPPWTPDKMSEEAKAALGFF
jgi:metal-sulfur cluster biosynthetic enzyme